MSGHRRTGAVSSRRSPIREKKADGNKRKSEQSADGREEPKLAEAIWRREIDKHIKAAECGDCASFRWLLDSYRSQQFSPKEVAQLRRCDTRVVGGAVNVQLEIFFARISREIWTSEHPVAKLRALIGHDKRGPKGKPDRRYHIALMVEALRKGPLADLQGRAGMTLEEALEEVSERECLSFEHVEKIYKSFSRRALRAEIAFRFEGKLEENQGG